MTVIYADVLFVVNFFITFLLLLITAKLSKRDERLWRYVVASFIGGAYSLVILIDDLSFLLSVAGKLGAACIIILIAFKLTGFWCYIKEVLIFFFVNLMFVGIIVGLWMIFKPSGIVINNSTVYFDISAGMLLGAAFIAYVISALAIRLYNNKTAKKELYSVTVFNGDDKVRFFAFADSGNNLREPFSDYPVIVADKQLFKNAPCQRFIPFSTVGGEGVLHAFKPEHVEVSTSKGSFSIENVYIALGDNMKKGEYQGILNPKILNI